MNIYLIFQAPKTRASHLCSAVAFVTAKTGVAAIAQAKKDFPDYIHDKDDTYKAPRAIPLVKADDAKMLIKDALYI